MERAPILVFAVSLLAGLPEAASGAETLSLGNGTVRVDIVPDRDGYREEWFSARGGRVAHGGRKREREPGRALGRFTPGELERGVEVTV